MVTLLEKFVSSLSITKDNQLINKRLRVKRVNTAVLHQLMLTISKLQAQHPILQPLRLKLGVFVYISLRNSGFCASCGMSDDVAQYPPEERDTERDGNGGARG